jgi:hypothetical protein
MIAYQYRRNLLLELVLVLVLVAEVVIKVVESVLRVAAVARNIIHCKLNYRIFNFIQSISHDSTN